MALWNQVGSPERVCLEVLAGELAEKMTWLLRSQHHWLEGGFSAVFSVTIYVW
ncbi:hypothetical protein HanPI659440_Chr03g0096941 [Helianthus annuus]|nr:hypothetical protein HanPI659440_Chr03g0096941 [Helianthus annuus]